MSAMNLTLAQAARSIAGAQIVGDAQTAIARVHTDTRTLQAGDLYVALRGERFDGAAFLSDAARAGAVGALADASARAALQASGLPGILAPDARRALGELAAFWRRQFDLPVIAVTGSNGKTTVTQMTAAILRAWLGDAAHATAGNFNNDIGVPLTVLGLCAAHRAAVVELGMNHPGEIAQLAAIAQPTVALVNNAQREHQEFMGTVEAVARENGAAIQALPAAGIAVYPGHDAYTPVWDELAGVRPRIRFGTAAPGAEVFIRTADWAGDHWRVQAHIVDRVAAFDLYAPGRHNLRNALAAAACAWAAGTPLDAIVQGLAAFRPVAGRSRAVALQYEGRALTLIDDSYNANPDSVRALIDLLAELPGPRLLLLGDLGEVGEQGPAFHDEVGRHARARGIEMLLTFGAQAVAANRAFSEMGGAGRHCATLESLNDAACAALPGVTSVAVKGSRFMRMERAVAALIAACAPVTAGSQIEQEAAHVA
ncbi:MAG: UDP-N-acetylmuramoyl-tripeptide--D-alanyl-D-alanine ligase [Burkholderiaceae bacterium]|jgi:UDP-N-acetylmuramoyl-tripeptide--D-alanyl-D-alanine ligase|nr:UDP-N-acetylmuramoyl-tripeptide--D-alanyl-D-alanine ligase [Burkholderiaceae bacterium]